MPKTLFLTAGHSILNGKGTGAHGIDGFDEAIEARKFVNAVIAHQKKWYHRDTLTDNDTDSLSTVINKQVHIVNGSFVCVEVHFNAGPSAASGTESYIPKGYTQEELTLAQELSSVTSEILGIKLRSGVLKTAGVKLENESQHSGLGILNKPYKATNILTEVCFITNPKDVAGYHKNFWRLVQAYSDILGNFCADK
jgi:N-acetylmuramoyl-L-alanine amidase